MRAMADSHADWRCLGMLCLKVCRRWHGEGWSASDGFQCRRPEDKQLGVGQKERKRRGTVVEGRSRLRRARGQTASEQSCNLQ
jgi:hypothetical protein